MKKRWISLLMVICLVVTLLPTFASAARPEGNEDGYQSLGSQSWTINAVNNWTPSEGQNAYGTTLYYKDGDTYRPMIVEADPYYYTAANNLTIGSAFSSYPNTTTTGYSTGAYGLDSSTAYYYLDGNHEGHRVYYNCYLTEYHGTGLTNWTADYGYRVQLYYYTSSMNSTGEVSSYATMGTALTNTTVALIDKDGSQTTGNNQTWLFFRTRGDAGDVTQPSNTSTSVSGLYTQGTNDSKLAMYYINASGKREYVLRNWDSRNTPTDGWTAELYYKVDPAVWTDPETVPVDDPDPEPYSRTIQNGTIINNPGRVNDKGLKLSKELSSADGEVFDITMESYSTANTTKTAVTEKVPTDFVLVVDQSGSMSTSDMPTGYSMITGSKTLEEIAAGNYYIKADDGNYYRVYAVRDYLYRYYAPNYWYIGDIVDRFGTDLGWFMQREEQEQSFSNQFYFRETDDSGSGVYHPITSSVRGTLLTYYMKFWYYNNAGQQVYFNREEETYVGTNVPYYHNVLNGNTIGPNWGVWPINYGTVDGVVQGLYPEDTNYTYSEIEILGAHTGMLVNYPMYDRKVGYNELRYRDVNGVEHTVSSMSGADTAEYCDASGQAITTKDGDTRFKYNKLYEATGTTTRLAALKAAVNEFAVAVANEKDTKTGQVSGVDNRVAIVGFSSEASNTSYNNTEILTGTNLTVSNNNGRQMRAATTTDYANALVPGYTGDVGTVNPKITAAINALTANGGTQPEYGLQMAKSILDNRSEKTYEMQTVDGNPTVNRNTIVIFFTDGQPGDYAYSNQYTEANEVVEAAKQLKDGGVQVFSIGVFGESDGNPLTYTHASASKVDGSWQYLGGWMENHYSGGIYYALRRQWRPNNTDYTSEANDTIFDYMSVTSSNYPSAQDYIAPAWLAGNYSGNYIQATDGVRGTSTGSNQFYRMASNQATLVAAFTQAVTHAGSINQSSTSIVLDATSEFRDAINIEDFDVSEATYTVYQQAIHVNENSTSGSMIELVGTPEEIQPARDVPATGLITYSGFDYAGNYVAYGKPDGYKLIVKVEGLKPTTFGVTVKSNADKNGDDGPYACGIYEYGDEDPAISVMSPTVNVKKSHSTYLADYNAPLILAKDATNIEGENSPIKEAIENNGTFSVKNGNAVYQLNSQSLNGKTAEVNTAYSEIDQATINGRHIADGEKANVQERLVKVIPASSVYYSDNLTTPVTVGEGIGYNAELGSDASMSAGQISGSMYFTFYGTGADVYCTTHSNAGYVSAAVFAGSGESACVAANRQGKAITMKNASTVDRYNTPTISFTGLTAGTYTIKINATEGAQYRLDGVRVYNPTNEAILADTSEGNATYLNLRKLLLNENSGFTVQNKIPETEEFDLSAITGVLFLDNAANLVTVWNDENGDPVNRFETNFAAYKADGPKNEIYLSATQGITFQMNVSKFTDETKVYLGISAPETGSGTVTINGKAVHPEVSSVMDMYYPVEFDLENAQGGTISVTVVNEGTSLISLTNLKITGVPDLLKSVANAPKMLFAPVTLKSVRMAANFGIDPEMDDNQDEEPEVTDVPTETANPEETGNPAVSDDPEDPDDDGSLIIDEPEETTTPEPSVSPEPSSGGNTIINGLRNVIQNITKSISNFFNSVFRR